MSHLYLAVALTALMVSSLAAAAPGTYTCPQSLPEASLRVEASEPGWKSFVSSPIYLHGAAVADGPPERLGVLKGQEVKTSKTGWTHKYTLPGTYPEGKWLQCSYGPLEQISLAKRLPDEVKECTVTALKGRHAGEYKIDIACK